MTPPGPARDPVGGWRARAAALALAALAAAAVLGALPESGPRTLGLFAVALGIGAVLRGARFGFTGAYRRLFTTGEAEEVRAQIVMLAVAMALFAPTLAAGSAFGRPAGGALAPFATQVAVGAFMFGVGMQLGGGCGSGTLNAAGAGSARVGATLLAFCAGSFWASLHLGWWQGLPSAGTVALGRTLDWSGALASQLAVLAVLWWWLGRRARGAGNGSATPGESPLPVRLTVAALALAAFNYLTLVLAGHPWTITWAFTLWGAKSAALLGWDPATSAFWSGGFPRRALEAPVLADVTSLMDLGIAIGALAAAGAAGRARLGDLRVPARAWVAALLGGVAMGYGARIAYGCNIGAFFSGVASTSLHGWLWIAAALPGNWVGVRLRPLFALP